MQKALQGLNTADNLGVGPALASIDVGHRIAQNAPGIVKMMARYRLAEISEPVD
jgi:hypothetical protein